MKLVQVDRVPEVRRKKGGYMRLQKLVDDFVNSGVRIARIDFDSSEYRTSLTCYHSMRAAVKASRYPISIIKRSDEIYLVQKI